MDGMTILSTYEHPIAHYMDDSSIIFTCVVIMVVCIAIGFILTIISEESGYIPIFLILGAIICLFTILFTRSSCVEYTYETHYKVILDDTVSINEFLDKYEIVDTDGEIYIVKELNMEDS